MTTDEANLAITQAGICLRQAHAILMEIRSGTPTDSVAHALAQARVYDIFTVNTQVWYLGAMIEQHGFVWNEFHECNNPQCPMHHGGNAPYCQNDPEAK